MKLLVCGGPKKRQGWVSMDALPWGGVTDILHDITEVPYQIPDGEVDELFSEETLEHVSFRDTDKVLAEWYRILRPGGKLTIQVPDIGLMCEYYDRGLVCSCVPHKADSWEGYRAREGCPKCGGEAKVNPVRWLYAFTGAQKHPYDTHKNVFTRESMELALGRAGFTKISFTPNIYKLIVTCAKPL